MIGIANVSSLMLVRGISRAREVSLRSVLGASRWQIVRLFVVESLVLTVAGALGGMLMALAALRALIAFGPAMPGLTTASLDLRAVAFAGALALVAGLIVGASPVALLARRGPAGLGTGSRVLGGGRGAHVMRSGFVVAQFALVLPLLAVSGLMLVSVARLQRVDPGFDPSNLVAARVSLPAGRYPGDTAMAAYWTRALARVRDLPGVRAAGIGSSLPPDDFGASNDNFNLIDRPAGPGVAEPNSPWPSADAAYFSALGVRLVDGRMFAPTDTGPAPVVLVSQSWAQHYYPGDSPIGKTLIRGGCTECVPSTIIGVVGDVRYSGWSGSLEAMYSPVVEQWPGTAYLYVRTAGSSPRLISAVREALRSVDPGVPLADIAPMEQRLYESLATPRQWASLLSAFAAAALSLAAVGVFGMLSYMVSTRRREIGMRMALGARRGRVLRMVIRSGVQHALAGTAIGLALAIVVARTLSPVLYDVRPYDPATLALAVVVLLGTTLAACWLPAHRAASVAPMDAIRVE
jgi:predicted permease